MKNLLGPLALLLATATGLRAQGEILPPPDPPSQGGNGGPGDTVPPPAGTGGRAGTPPTPIPAEPDSSGSGASSRPSPAPTSSAPSPPPLVGPRVPTSVGAGGGIDLSTWTWWWEFNKEPFLDLRGSLDAAAVTTGSDGFFLGRGYRDARTRPSRRPSEREIREKVLPALLRALGRDPSRDVLIACLIALARIGDDLHGDRPLELDRVIRPFLRHPSREVVETAAVALGILGEEGSMRLLTQLMLDAPEGRTAVGRSRVSVRTRAFAAYGLGLIGHESTNEDVRRYAVGRLARALSIDDTPTPDLGVACAIAIGRIPLAWSAEPPATAHGVRRPPVSSSREAQILFLLDRLKERRLDRIVRAHLPISLGLLARAGPRQRETPLRQRVASALLERLDEHRRGSTRELRSSCAIALGYLADAGDDELGVRGALLSGRGFDSDREAYHFALLSAARIAARPGTGGDAGLRMVRSALLQRLAAGASDERRWAGLALGVLERARSEAGSLADPDVARSLRHALSEASSPLDVGAFSIALGLIRDRESSGDLLRKLGTTREDQAQGHVAIALGMLPAPEAREPIRRVVEEAFFRPRLLREAGISLGLLGDDRATGLFVEELARARSQSTQAAISRALGRIGDRDTIEPLVEILDDEELTERARSFAAVALGLIADGDPLPWNTVFAVDVNYTAAPTTLLDPAGLGILNLL